MRDHTCGACFDGVRLRPATEVYLLKNTGVLRGSWVSAGAAVCCREKFAFWPHDLSSQINLRSLTNTVFVLLVVWCRWPRTHSTSGMPAMKTVRRASVAVVPPCVCAQVLVVLFHSVLWDHGGLLWSTASSGVTCRAGLSDECSSRWCLVGTLAPWESVLLNSSHYRSLA